MLVAPLYIICTCVASRNPVSRTVEKERNSDFEYLKIFYFFRTFLRYNVDNNIKIRCELGKTSFRSFSWLLSNHFFIFTGFKNTGQPKGCMEITSATRAIYAVSSYKSKLGLQTELSSFTDHFINHFYMNATPACILAMCLAKDSRVL